MTRFFDSWEDLLDLYRLPFPELLFQAHTVHRENFDPLKVQRATLLSIKTGGCKEDCAYCPQSARYDTGVEAHKLLSAEFILARAKDAKASGSTRFCMGAAWREVREGRDFESILEAVSAVAALGLEVCCTLGMLNASQAERLKKAGCHAYNHNLDSSREFYKEIITTRTYDERLATLRAVREAGMTVCCGGILGMGESVIDRMKLLFELTLLKPQPESVPINMLVKVSGTPLGDKDDSSCEITPLAFARSVAVARIALPKSFVRLSAGRRSMSDELQALLFFAGANSIFAGEKLLTTPNATEEGDNLLFKELGMSFNEAFDSALDTAA
jgi:biotin synthase